MTFKKIVVFVLIAVLLVEGSAFAETMGEVVFRDAMYGAMIGGLLGTALYLASGDDDKDFLKTIGVGVALGTVGGLIYGAGVDAKSMAELDSKGFKFALPSPVVREKDGGLMVSASLLKVSW